MEGGCLFPLLPAGIISFIASGLLSMKFPRCPNCGTPANMPDTYSDGRGFWIHPDRPKKECGYCGPDLT